jgi:hypothetical protein
MQDRASMVQPHDPALGGSHVVSYNISTSKPYFIEFRLRTPANKYIEKSFSLRPIQGRTEELIGNCSKLTVQ